MNSGGAFSAQGLSHLHFSFIFITINKQGLGQIMARAMEILVSDPRKRKEMGGAARADAVEKFSESIVIERVLALYRSMVETS